MRSHSIMRRELLEPMEADMPAVTAVATNLGCATTDLLTGE